MQFFSFLPHSVVLLLRDVDLGSVGTKANVGDKPICYFLNNCSGEAEWERNWRKGKIR